MQSQKGDWFLTFTGRQFWPLDPHPEDIDIRDIAHHLSLTCRFNGACRVFYSVAQHSCIVSDALTDQYKFVGLLHDATEAYCGDMVRPLKRFMPDYQKVEENIWSAVCTRFKLLDLPDDCNTAVKQMDNRALMTERRDLLISSSHEWSMEKSHPPFPETIDAWPPAKAEEEFLNRFFKLMPDYEC